MIASEEELELLRRAILDIRGEANQSMPGANKRLHRIAERLTMGLLLSGRDRGDWETQLRGLGEAYGRIDHGQEPEGGS